MWAEQLGARAVVLHLERVPVDSSFFRRTVPSKTPRGPTTPELLESMAAVLAARERLREPHLDAVLRCVEGWTARRCVAALLGIENRFHPHEFRCATRSG